MTLPLSKLDLLAGYGIAFALVAAVQAVDHGDDRVRPARPRRRGSIVVVVALAVCNALLGVALGLLASAFAQTEFQAVQFMPAFVLPQFLLCGLLVPRDQMAAVLEWISVFLPLTWAYDGLARAVAGGDAVLIARDAAIVLGVTLVALALGAATLRRRTPCRGRPDRGDRLRHEHEERAEQVGRLLAERGATVVCGGLGEVMGAAARGRSRRAGRRSGSSPARAAATRTSGSTTSS